MDIDWKKHYLETYAEIIAMCNEMPITELEKYQRRLKLYSISYKHQIISSEVLKHRYTKSLNNLESDTFKMSKQSADNLQ